jgi:signal transduction histidine kinase
MPPRRSHPIAWSIWLLTLACWAAALSMRLAYSLAPPGSPSALAGGVLETAYQGLVAATFLGIPTLGLIVAARRPASSFGWLLLAFGLFVALPVVLKAYVQVAVSVAGGRPTDAAVLAAWLANWVGLPAFGLLGPLFVLFPTGRAPSPRWYPVIGFLGATTVAGIVSTAFRPGPLPGFGALAIVNPVAVAGAGSLLGTLQQVGLVCLAVGMVAAAGSLVARLRSAQGDERQQVKWVAYGAVVYALGLTANLLSPPAWKSLTGGAYLLALNGWVITVGLAILKHRLYDIDPLINRTLVYGALAACITVVYVAGVVGIGALVGGRGELGADLLLSLVATAVVAMVFQPLRRRVERLANRLVYGHRASPYEVLAEFSRGLARAPSLDEVLPRMAEAAARGVGAARSRVRVHVPGGRDQAVTWPPGSHGQTFERTAPVLHQGTPVGDIAVAKPPGEPLTRVEETLLADLAAQAGPALATLRLTLDLRASRQRLVAAQDAERRRLERDIHDGAQQNLIALAVQLRLARQLLGKDPALVAPLFDDLDRQAKDALGTLRDLARGIFPPMLADRGLVDALKAHLLRACPAARLETDAALAAVRYAPEVEAAVYFCCLEALQNTGKHAADSPVALRLSDQDGWLVFSVRDDGPGFDAASDWAGTGLRSMADRLAALDGTLEVASAPGRGTTVSGRVPLRPVGPGQDEAMTAAHAAASRSGPNSALGR